MPSYKTLVQILIATSVASSAVAAPVITFPEEGGSHTGKSSEPSTSVAPENENPATHELSANPSTYPPRPEPVPAGTQAGPPSGPKPDFTFKHVAGAFGAGVLGGGVAGGLTTAMGLKTPDAAQRAQANSQNSTAKRFVEDGGHISRSLANLSDEHLRFLRDISHWVRALEGLD